MNGDRKCKHTLVRTIEKFGDGMEDKLYVCSKCGYRCEPAIAEKED